MIEIKDMYNSTEEIFTAARTIRILAQNVALDYQEAMILDPDYFVSSVTYAKELNCFDCFIFEFIRVASTETVDNTILALANTNDDDASFDVNEIRTILRNG